MTVAILPAGFPPFAFDAVTSETWEHTTEATKFPVEVGVDISDHLRPNAAKFSVVGIISQSPTVPFSGQFSGPLPPDAEYYQAPPTQQLSAVLAAITGGPPPPLIQATQSAIPFDFMTDAHDYFRAIQDGAILCEVAASTNSETDMALISATIEKQGPGKLQISASFEKITTVSTATVAAPLPAIPAGNPKVSAGPQGTTPSPDEIKSSALKSIVGLAGL